MRVDDRSRTRYAILGALSLGPSSGYQLKRDLDDTVGHFWSESFGQIYPILARLERDNLIRVVDSAGTGRRPRRIFALTSAGEAALEAWLAEPVEERTRPRSELLLKVFFGASLPAGVTLEHVRAHRRVVTGQLEVFRAIASDLEENPEDDPGHRYRLATLRYGLLNTEAVLRWCDETIVVLAADGTT